MNRGPISTLKTNNTPAEMSNQRKPTLKNLKILENIFEKLNSQ